ncbi:MAG TPA: FecR domain-containing protein [Pyrinomonadaceae bacterium]|nr:FecR domain-containing protein [Pyrinomonadaceae bacterium]
MKSNNDETLDRVTAEIRSEAVDPVTVEAAANRVWARVSAAAGAAEVQLPAVERIEGCADFQSLIPAYLSGSLSEARSLLLVDHTHECIPCRKAMKQARERRLGTIRKVAQAKRFNLSPVVLRWGIAAAVIIGVGLLAVPLLQRYSPFGGQFEATVQAAEGPVYQVADSSAVALKAGAKLQKGDRVRTAKDGHAFVRLGDGSVIEMKDRSELYLTKNGQGTTIHLDRGNIMVEAAKQGSGHLFVDTGDSLVSVTGTVFSVNNGTKGSRVSVVEGEVRLNHAGSERVLRPGEQGVTNPSIATIPVKDEVAWSRNAGRYAQVLAGLSGINASLSKVTQPGLRNSTHLLDLMPEDTVVYAALPNLTNTIAESHRIIEQRLSQNPALKEWWEKEHSGSGQNMDQVIETIRQFGDYLGEEIAVSVPMDGKGKPAAPLVLAELKNSEGFREFLEQQIATYSNGHKAEPSLVFVENPLTTPAGAETTDKKEQLYVWIQNGLMAASPELKQLQGLGGVIAGGGSSQFVATPFHDRISQVYQEGAGLVVAANLERVVAETKADRAKGPDAEKRESALGQLGILNVKYFVLDQKETNGKTHTQASLSFSESQRGIPSWLAAPGPMGSLEYISPDANVVTGFVVKNPVALVDDLLGVMSTVAPELRKTLDKQQELHGLNIRSDIAAPLGGEFAFAIDGPILPTPSWKLVFEVNDPQHLQQTLERIVTEVNAEAARISKAGLSWEQNEIGGRTYYTLHSAEFPMEVSYCYANGYMIVGPSRALVERSLRSQEAGYNLLHSSKFTAGLPADGNANFSAVFYHNLAPLVQPLADKIATAANSLPAGTGKEQAMRAMAADMPPTLAYAYAQGDTIIFAANTDGGPFGLSPATILGMPNALEMQSIIQRGMSGKN